MKQRAAIFRCAFLLLAGLLPGTLSGRAQAQAPAPALAHVPVPDRQVASRVDEYMEALLRVRGYGASVLIARGDRVIVSRGYGLANAELGVANTPETVFRIGSITKPFTAAAILLLQERGRLSTQDLLCAHLADCPEAWRAVTLHHLLTHSSGIANVTALPDWNALKTLPAAPAAVVARFSPLPLRFAPGERFEYSNSNYILLGLVIERASGQAYEAFMREAVFAPLGLESTDYDHPARLVRNRAAGYSRDGASIVNAPYADMSLPFAAGALHSTTGDLLRWARALEAPGFLSQRSLEAMFTPFRQGYAYGWGVGTLLDRRHVGHTGGIEGFSTHISRFPDERATVIVLSNNDAAVANVIARDLAAILFGEPYEIPSVPRQVAIDPRLYDEYVGRYEIAPGAVLTVTRDGPRLMATSGADPGAEIFPASETEFFLRVIDARISFVRGEGGRVTGLVLHQNGQDVPARKVE
ncbi:MAG TPA: serine hydrolase [Allosphingosinicella sp.]|nr:serine hydrolase [Allosphingosinicella sp.]